MWFYSYLQTQEICAILAYFLAHLVVVKHIADANCVEARIEGFLHDQLEQFSILFFTFSQGNKKQI